MLIRRCGLPISGRGWRWSSGPTGTTRTSRSPRRARPQMRLPSSRRSLPGRVGRELRFHVTRDGSSRERLRNLLSRLDSKRVWGTLSLIESTQPMPAAGGPTPRRSSLVNAWDDAVARLAPGWSDLLCELELDSTDHLPRAALLGAPMNPTRNPGAIALRFRVSGKQGYGASRRGWPGGASSGWTQTGSRGGSRSWASSPTRRTPIRRAPSAGGRTLRLRAYALSERSSRIPSCPRGHADRTGSAGSRSF